MLSCLDIFPNCPLFHWVVLPTPFHCSLPLISAFSSGAGTWPCFLSAHSCWKSSPNLMALNITSGLTIPGFACLLHTTCSIWHAHWMHHNYIRYNAWKTKLISIILKTIFKKLFYASENEMASDPAVQSRRLVILISSLIDSPHLFHLPALSIFFIKCIANHLFTPISVASALA